MLRSILSFSLLGGAVALGACSSQAGTTYRGETLASLKGTVHNDGTKPVKEPVPTLVLALAWSGQRLGSDPKASVWHDEVASEVPVTGQFPESFTIDILTPPPSDALFSCFDDNSGKAGKLATAQVEALLESAVATTKKDITDLYGVVFDYTVVYADVDLPAENNCLPGGLSKGYHLGQIGRGPDIPGCVSSGVPDDPKCWGPVTFTEVPLSTNLTLVLQHEDGMATPPSPTH